MAGCNMFCVTFLALCGCIVAQMDTSICDPSKITSTPPRKPFPALPDVFASHISMNIVSKQTTREMYELFDSPNNRALVRETEATGPYKNISLTGHSIYNFYSNQLVEIVGLGGVNFCTAEQLDGKGSDSWIFGNDATKTTGFSAKTAFYVDDRYPPLYQGPTTLSNGVKAESWKGCAYISARKATVEVEYFFSDPNWTTSIGAQVPLMIKIKGKADLPGPARRDIEHVYTFSGYQDFITDHQKEYFEVPPGTVCPYLAPFQAGASDKDAHTMPLIAQGGYFRFSAELVQKADSKSELVNNIREIYDSKMQMSRYDFNAAGFRDTFENPLADRPFSEVHDFVTGIAYIIDREKGNCTIGPLAAAAEFDVLDTANNHVRMKTVQEFFGLGPDNTYGTNWTYVGQRKIRDITADVYVANRTGYPPSAGPDASSIWEIAFMARDDVSLGHRSTNYEAREPIRLYINNLAMGREDTYNIYNFDESEPDFYLYDVATCYSDDQKTPVTFELPGDQREKIENNRKQFYYWLLLSLAGELLLVPSRIHHPSFEYDAESGNIKVSFVILDPPNIVGSTRDDLPKNYMISTSDALALLKIAIDGGDFVVEGGNLDDKNLVSLTAIKGSLNRKPEAPEAKTIIKLNQGAAAGIGIGFLIGGIALGVLIIFIVNKVRGKSFPNLSLSFTPKTYEQQNE